MKGLRPGGHALIIKSALVPENLGREVQVLSCLGVYRKGERVDLGNRFMTVKQGGVMWHIRGVNRPLKAMLLGSSRIIPTWELAAHACCLLPLDDDTRASETSESSLEKRSEP